VREALRAIGIVAILIGGLCSPVGYGINPERDLSVFHNLADRGMFQRVGVILVGVGVAVLFGAHLVNRGQRS
jgi:uncharacterized protein YjeT (DUF2065 family)